jgi:two-component system phosphate regulon response regulator PhoB
VSGQNEDQEFKVLLIEDEPVIRELVRSVLTQGPVSVDCASDGLEGLKLAKTRAFQLILLDVVLPLLDGISVCRTLKSHPETAGVPLYMLTAKAKRSDVDTAMKAGADGYIHKPFRGTELMELVDRLRVSAQSP